MSVGYPIDVTRLLGDNQRFQRDLSLLQQHQQQMRLQLDQALAENKAMRIYCEQVDRQKQEELERFMQTHRQLYESELSTLRAEREQLIEQIETYDQKEHDTKFEEAIEKLREQIKKHETQKTQLQTDFQNVKKMMSEQQSQISQRFQRELKVKEFQINNLEKINFEQTEQLKAVAVELSTSNQARAKLEANYGQLKQKYEILQQRWKTYSDKSSAELVQELISLRKDNLAQKRELSTNQLQVFSSDQDVYIYLKRLHEELAVLRYELTEAKNNQSEGQLAIHNERAQFRSEKAQQQLCTIKLQKENCFLKEQEKTIHEQLKKVEEKLNLQAEQIATMEKLEEQIALLRIKVFVLESLRSSEKYRKYEQVDYSKMQSQLSSFSAFKSRSSRIDVVKNVVSMNAAMSQTIDKLKQEEFKRREANRKAKEYKSRWETLCKRESQLLRSIQHSKQKEEQYQKLIEKIQAELQKAFASTSQASQRQNVQLLIASYEQKIQMTTNQVHLLQSQIKHYENQLQVEKKNLEKITQKLNAETSQLQANYNQLQQKNRILEAQILEQALSFTSNKVSKNYQTELAEQTAAVIFAEQQLQVLRDHLCNQKEINSQNLLEISHLKLEIAALNQQLLSPNNFQYEISYLQQKLAYLQGALGEQRNSSNDNHLQSLYQQIAHLKAESNDIKLDTMDRSDRAYIAQREIESYRGRMIELEQTLRKIAHENQQKSLEIFRLNEENNVLSKQLDKVQEELDVMRGKAASMRQIELIGRNRELEESSENIHKEYSKAMESLNLKEAQIQALRKQCDEYWSDNLRLLLVIKENNVQLKENKFLSEKYDQEVSHRQTHLENKTQSLITENTILKNLVEDLRKTLLEKQTTKQNKEYSLSSDYEAVKIELEGKEKEVIFLKEELHRQIDEKLKQKEIFDIQWNKLVAQLNHLKQQLEKSNERSRAKSEVAENESRVVSMSASSQVEEASYPIIDNYIKRIEDLEIEIHLKNEKLDYLEMELREYQVSMHHSGIYSQEVIQLRSQVQTLLEGRFLLEDKLRILEQENSLLKIRKISEEPAEIQLFSQETFGPSIGTNKLIEQLRETDKEIPAPNTQEMLNWKDRYEESLCMLVISWAEIQSLRMLLVQSEQRSSQYYNEYTERLNDIENSLKTNETLDVNLNLLRELECGHKHLLQLTQNRMKEGNYGMAQVGSFDSITGGKLIESYSVREEDQSLTSQEIIHF